MDPSASPATSGERIVEIVIFGDQTDNVRLSLRALLDVNPDPMLQRFLEESFRYLRFEILRTSVDFEISDQNFSNLLELLDVVLGGAQAVALEHALTTVCHFGLFFEKCRQSQGIYPGHQTTKYVGICTGSLAAAAISCCQSSLELLPVALQTTLLAYRLGAHAAQTGVRYFGEARGDRCCAVTVLDARAEDVAQIIARFSVTKNLPEYLNPYISSIWAQGVTISGSPEVLEELHKFGGLGSSTVLPIHAPYHAPHLYDRMELNILVNQSVQIANWHDGTQDLLQIPGSDRQLLNSSVPSGLSAALARATESIFIDQVDFGDILNDIKRYIISSRGTKARFVPIASNAAATIRRALSTGDVSSDGIETMALELANEIVRPYDAVGTRNTNSQYHSRSKIAIVGMACRLPYANNVDEFWDLLCQGLDVHEVVPPSRWDATTHVDTSEKPRKNTSATPYGCWLQEPALFDGRFFGMSPRECEQVDPAQRLALMTAYEALEDGGIVPGDGSSQRNRTGVCYGVTSNDWMETNSAQDIDTYMISGGNRAFIPGRINYFFKFSGPSLAIDTACSSSLAAIHTACNILWRGEADTMLAGGTNVLTNPDFTAGLDRGHFLSRTGGCKTFDDGADGYCRGEGVVSVVLKRLDDAIRDGDPIKGVIVNVQTNHSAEAESITRPSLQAQRDVFARVLDGLSPANVSYVEMHGTGTQVGDATEMSSLLEVLAPRNGPQRLNGTETVHLGSVKANVGHGEAAAGATSLVKLLLMMEKKMIPPHVGVKTRLNRRFPNDMSALGVQIASNLVEWVSRGPRQPRYALLNNFSAAGGNTALLLQEFAKSATALRSDPRSTHPLVLSAKTATALRGNARAMLSHLKTHPGLSASSLSYTTTARRMHHLHRLAIAGSTIEQFIRGLSAFLDEEPSARRPAPTTAVFAFTGQGSHYVGMGRQLYNCLGSFRRDIDKYSQIARRNGFSPFLPLITEEKVDLHQENSESVQLAIVSLQMALAKLWVSWGITPAGVIGHSLGHYAALNAAGVISEADTIFLVGTRAQLMQQHCKPGTHKMLCVRATRPEISRILPDRSKIEIACINGPHEVVLTGPATDVDELLARITSEHISCRVLDVPFAFHSAQVDCFLDAFRLSISGVKFKSPRIPVICPRRQGVTRARDDFSASHLVDHCRGQVNLVGALEAARRECLVTDDTLFLEIGHNSSVTSMLKAILGNSVKACPSLMRNKDPWTTLVHAVNLCYQAGFNTKWREYHRDFSDALEVVPVPHYKWDFQSYWIQYRNDWSLRKGDAVSGAARPAPSLLSTSIHRVVKEEPFSESGTIVVHSGLTAPDLHPIVQGHKVNGIPLATPSIYADIALTIANYVCRKYEFGGQGRQISITDMVIEKALVVPPTSQKVSKWLQTEAKVASDQGSFMCTFSSLSADGVVSSKHAQCTVRYCASVSSAEVVEKTSQTKANIDSIRRRMRSGAPNCFMFNSKMVYRMVAILAQFDRGYQGLKEVILDSNNMAAASKVNYSTLPDCKGLSFTVHPAHLDSLIQSAGFVMNANEASDLEVECFVNHGWDALMLIEPLQADKEYECYVQMVRHTDGNGVWKGDMSVVCENTLIAVIKGITLQGLPIRLLHHVLSAAQTSQRDHSPQEYALSAAETSHVTPEPRQGDTSGRLLSSRLDQITNIVSEESGIPCAELDDDTELSSVGVDSLMALLVTSRLKDELDFDIGSGLSIFGQFRTLRHLKESFIGTNGHARGATTRPPAPSRTLSLDGPNGSVNSGPDHDVARRVTSLVLYQAVDACHDSPTLFLFPDGSGSPMSYVPLAGLATGSSMNIVSLVCPYRKDPQGLRDISLDELLISYVEEIRRRQPRGPYSLGGWSSGGIFAYRASQILIDLGETARHLILIDSPAPIRGLERLPQRFYEHCASAGLFGQIEKNQNGVVGDGDHPEWLLPHFNATIDLLSSYCAEPMAATCTHAGQQNQCTSVVIVWAGRPALNGDQYPKFKLLPEDGEGVRFLSQTRTDYGPSGWESLVVDTSIQIHVLKGFDHFDMMVS
ncbi:polyketide synthase module [Diaporthe sp. PMI_573]|nr:polyketide synthase module [Diaporthaceae sp. PMI_573]